MDKQVTVFHTRYLDLPAFDLAGFTAIVRSGGELYRSVRSDDRWDLLRALAGNGGAIYGVASLDKECPRGRYRYTLAVRAPLEAFHTAGRGEGVIALHIAASHWLAFAIDSFAVRYGQLWRADPYRLLVDAGWSFNQDLGLHMDAFGPSYTTDDDAMEFMMPVKPRAGNAG